MRKFILSLIGLTAMSGIANATPISGSYTVSSNGAATIAAGNLDDHFALDLALNTPVVYTLATITETARTTSKITAQFVFTSPVGVGGSTASDGFSIGGNDSLMWGNGGLDAVNFADGSVLDLTFANETGISGSLTPTVTFDLVRAATRPVPEPFTLSLFGVGLAGAAAMRRRKKAQKA